MVQRSLPVSIPGMADRPNTPPLSASIFSAESDCTLGLASEDRDARPACEQEIGLLD